MRPSGCWERSCSRRLARRLSAQQFPSKPITLVVPYARRRQRRHQRPRAAGRHRRRARPADHHREPPRRRRHDRRRLCRALGAGRPHAVRRLERADPARPDDHAEAALPMGQGVRAGQHARGRHQHAAGDAEAAGEDRGRAGRLRQEESRQAHASPRRAAPASTISWPSCSSSRPASPGPRCTIAATRRRSTTWSPATSMSACMQLTDSRQHIEGRPAPRAGGARAQARAGGARRADHRRGGPAGRAGHHLQRPVRAEGHAAGGGREAQRGDPRGAGEEDRDRQARRARLRRARQHAGGIHQVPRAGNPRNGPTSCRRPTSRCKSEQCSRERQTRAASVLAEDRPQLSQAQAEAAARRLRLPLPFHRAAEAVHAQAEPRVQPSRVRGHDVRGLGEDAGRARPVARPARDLDDVRAQLRDRAARAEPAAATASAR